MMEAIPFNHENKTNDECINFSLSFKYVNILNQKAESSQWSNGQLQVFITRLSERENFEGKCLKLCNFYGTYSPPVQKYSVLCPYI